MASGMVCNGVWSLTGRGERLFSSTASGQSDRGVDSCCVGTQGLDVRVGIHRSRQIYKDFISNRYKECNVPGCTTRAPPTSSRSSIVRVLSPRTLHSWEQHIVTAVLLPLALVFSPLALLPRGQTSSSTSVDQPRWRRRRPSIRPFGSPTRSSRGSLDRPGPRN